MQRVLDPTQIEAFAQRSIPRIRLPDAATIFANRAARLRKLSEGHSIGDYLRLMAAVCDAQQAELAQLSGALRDAGPGNGMHPGAAPDDDRSEERMRLARAHGMPLLQATDWPRDARWRVVLNALCTAIAAAPGFPPAVGDTCRRIRALPVARLEEQADQLLDSGGEGIAQTSGTYIDAQAAPFVTAALQVYWAHLACCLGFDAIAEHVATVDVPGLCPVCGTLPVASIVRADKAYQGYRYLHCALCDTEWHMVRIKCSQCESTAGIHYHSIEGRSAAVRAEACDNCRSYRKICYQEQDVEVEPVADDLATLALDLLMTEEGYHRASGHPLLRQAR
jgi:FdhE protein